MNYGILIDIFYYKDILTNLIEFLNCDPSIFYGIILILDKKNISDVFIKKKGKERIDFLNSTDFFNSVKSHYEIAVNNNKKLILIQKKDEYFDTALKILLNNFPEDYIISVVSDISDIDTFRSLDFTGINILCDSDNVIFSKYNKPNTVDNLLIEKQKFYGAVKDNCKIKLVVKDLDKIYTKGLYETQENRISQVEISGKMKLVKIDNFTVTIVPDDFSILTGENDSVQMKSSLYSFHTHHYSLYDEYETNLGYPSAADYYGVYLMYKICNSIVHFVVANEGVYSICISPDIFDEFMDNTKVKNFINDKLDIDKKFMMAYDVNDTITNYLTFINESKFEDKHLFIVDFFENKQMFEMDINFKKTNCNCIIDDVDQLTL